MNSYRYRPSRYSLNFSASSSRKLLIVALIVFICATIGLAVFSARSSRYRSQMKDQFQRRIVSSTLDAIDQVNRLSGGVQTNSATRLALIRQHVYFIDQLNDIIISTEGEGARLVPKEAVKALYDDLDTYDKLIQTATSSTIQIRSTLLTHLSALQEILTKRK